MATQLAKHIPVFQRPPHTIYVSRLYKRSLRLCKDWYWGREECREKAFMIRQMFEKNRTVDNAKLIDELLLDTEYQLAKYYHPIPFKYPTAPGGSKWERNIPFPEELCKRGAFIHAEYY